MTVTVAPSSGYSGWIQPPDIVLNQTALDNLNPFFYYYGYPGPAQAVTNRCRLFGGNYHPKPYLEGNLVSCCLLHAEAFDYSTIGTPITFDPDPGFFCPSVVDGQYNTFDAVDAIAGLYYDPTLQTVGTYGFIDWHAYYGLIALYADFANFGFPSQDLPDYAVGVEWENPDVPSPIVSLLVRPRLTAPSSIYQTNDDSLFVNNKPLTEEVDVQWYALDGSDTGWGYWLESFTPNPIGPPEYILKFHGGIPSPGGEHVATAYVQGQGIGNTAISDWTAVSVRPSTNLFLFQAVTGQQLAGAGLPGGETGGHYSVNNQFLEFEVTIHPHRFRYAYVYPPELPLLQPGPQADRLNYRYTGRPRP